MTTAADELLDQAHALVARARVLPVDEAAVVLEQVATICQAGQAETLIDGERSGELRDSGRATVRTFATGILRRSDPDAGHLSHVARHLVDFPRLAAAYRAGAAHTANLRAIMTHVRPCGLDALQAHEGALLLLATRAGPSEIHAFCRHLAEVTHPDGDEGDVRRQGLRMVRIARVGDLAHLDAMLDPVLADQLKAALAAMARAARTPEDDRTHAERSADALEDVLRRGMDTTTLPTVARKRPHTTMTVDLATLLGPPGHGQALLERFGLIPVGVARRVACDSLVRLLVTDGDRVLSVGRSQRVVSDRQLAALAATYPTCAMPGCQVRFSDCEVHHCWWWSLGGPTDLDLQAPLCKHDHTRVHEHGYTLTREHGRWVFRDPKGRVIGDPVDVLDEQLDLLHQHQTSTVDPIAVATGRYDTGSWGWTGQDPNPPPGHGPPQRPVLAGAVT